MFVGIVQVNVSAAGGCDGLYDEDPPCYEMCDDSNDSDSDS